MRPQVQLDNSLVHFCAICVAGCTLHVPAITPGASEDDDNDGDGDYDSDTENSMRRTLTIRAKNRNNPRPKGFANEEVRILVNVTQALKDEYRDGGAEVAW